MMQSILQTTIKSHITSSTKYSILQIPSRDRTIVGSGNTSQIFRGSMFTRVVPTRKCASCG